MKLYKETNFQETPIGKIPKEWEVAKLKNTCELIRGTEPGSKTYNKDGKGFKFIRVSDISKQILETVFVDEKPENLVFCHKEDVLLALDGVPGIVAKGMEGAISSGIRIVKPVNKIDNDFLFYILQHSIVQKVIKNYTTGTTIKHASRAVDFITLPLPPFQEQQKIAEILSTVDEAIQKTNEIIAKTERLKKGLMQELLTKGIGHKEFKDTEIGRIPKEWEVGRENWPLWVLEPPRKPSIWPPPIPTSRTDSGRPSSLCNFSKTSRGNQYRRKRIGYRVVANRSRSSTVSKPFSGQVKCSVMNWPRRCTKVARVKIELSGF